MTDFRRYLELLSSNSVEFILVGGAAATAHGSSRLTLDIDVVYRRSNDNMERIVRALAPLRPYLRGAPRELPFLWDRKTLQRGLNFRLTAAYGDIDLLGEVAGGGSYDDLLPYVELLEPFGIPCPGVTIEKLIVLKRSAGRPKDFEAIAELEAILEERGDA